MTFTRERKGNRTLLFEDDLHVGTILKQAKNHYVWYVPSGSGQADTLEQAERAIHEELER